MKIITAPIFLIFIPPFFTGRPGNKPAELPTPSPYVYNYKKCIFTANISAWTQHQGKDALPVTTILNNTADDTLKYETMTERMFAYHIKSDALEYEYAHDDILKNFPEVITIPPHQSDTLCFNLVKKNDHIKTKGSLILEFCLVFPKDKMTIFLNEDPFSFMVDEQHHIIPHSADLISSTHWLSSKKFKI